MSTATLDQVLKTGKPVDRANFGSRSQRKAYRKSLRSKIANRLIDHSLDSREKQQYYRTLRLVKMRRRRLINEFQLLVTTLESLRNEINRVYERTNAADPTVIAAAWGAANDALSAADATLAEIAEFSRRPVIHYRKAV